MSDEKKPRVEKTYVDENKVEHHPECPATKKAFGKEGGGPCVPIDFDRPFAIAVVAPVSETSRESSSIGPAQVATRAYRDGWELLFGAKNTVGQA